MTIFMSLDRLIWLAQNLGSRNDVRSVFYSTLTFCEGVGNARKMLLYMQATDTKLT